MDAKFDGRVDYKKFLLNDFYNAHRGNIYVFGGEDIRYRSRLLGKHIATMYQNYMPTIVFFSAPYNSGEYREIYAVISHLKNQLHDHQNRLIYIDKKYPYYHPLLNIDAKHVIKVIDNQDMMLHDESAYLDALITLMKADHIPIKLHSILEYMNHDLSQLIARCDQLIQTSTNTLLKSDLKNAKNLFEEEQISNLSTATPRKLLKDLQTSITDINHKNCCYSITNAIKNNQILCINLAGDAQRLLPYFQAELRNIASQYHIILFDVNCSVNEEFETEMVNTDLLSIYSKNFNRDFNSEYRDALLGKQNVTLLFKMPSGSASPIVDYYGDHDYTYTLENYGKSHGIFDFLHLHDNRHAGYHQQQQTVNRLSGNHVSSLQDNFECFEIHDNDIIYHMNVSYADMMSE
ncbi:MAG: hypothetical protein LUH02_09620 [Erysipelotrichaceae bacterium]|nr:hypothetical protein [Erysipelotrichaceae bacterium]